MIPFPACYHKYIAYLQKSHIRNVTESHHLSKQHLLHSCCTGTIHLFRCYIQEETHIVMCYSSSQLATSLVESFPFLSGFGGILEQFHIQNDGKLCVQLQDSIILLRKLDPKYRIHRVPQLLLSLLDPHQGALLGWYLCIRIYKR